MLTQSRANGRGPSGAPPPASSARWTLASLSLAVLLSALGVSIANIGLPALALAFDASFGDVQWVVLAYLLAITTLIVSVGRVGDLVGRRRLMLAGIALYTLASFICAVAPSLGVLIAARAVQGLGAAVMMTLALAFVTAVVPKERTGSAMGLLGTMSAVGTAIGPTAGGLLIAGFGWPGLFLVPALVGVVAWLLALRFLPVERVAAGAGAMHFDTMGTVLLAVTLAAYALAMTLGHGHFGLSNLALLLAAAVGAGVFAYVQSKVAAPLIRLALLRDPVLRAGFAMSALVTSVVMATLVVGPFYLASALRLDAAQVGLVMSCGPIVAALAGIPAGRLVDRLGAQRIGSSGLVAMALGAIAVPMLAPGLGIIGYVAPLAVLTAGYALFQAANNTAVMTQIQGDQRGVVSALLHLARNLGLITGASLMGAVYAVGAATGNIATATPSAATAGMRMTFAVAVLLIFAAIAIAAAHRALTPRLQAS